MRILVTGATGFIGTHLVFSLLESGHNVAIFKRKDSGLKGLVSIQEKVQVFASDTYADIYLGIKEFVPDVVVHLAAVYVNQHKSNHIVDLVNSNILFGTHILEAMTEHNVSKFLNIGTRWQHLGNKRYNPANLYAATKGAFKDILIYYGTKGITHKTIELCDTFGRGDTRRKILDILIAVCQKHESVDLTPGEQILDLSSVGDICQFIVSHLGSYAFFDNKTVSLSGRVIKLRDLGMLLEKKYNTSGLFNWGARAYRPYEVMTPPVYYQKVQLDQNSLERYLDSFGDSL